MKKANEEWKKRRKGCIDVCGNFCETAGMNKKQFIEKLEIETDEAINVVCPV